MNNAQSDDDLGAQLLSAVAKLNRWASRHSEIPIPTGQARLLSLVEQYGPARIGELAEADHSSQPTMTAQVKRLELQGLLVRTEDEDDGRASLIALTGAGRAVLREARIARSAAIAPVLAELSEQDLAVLRRTNQIFRQIVADQPARD